MRAYPFATFEEMAMQRATKTIAAAIEPPSVFVHNPDDWTRNRWRSHGITSRAVCARQRRELRKRGKS